MDFEDGRFLSSLGSSGEGRKQTVTGGRVRSTADG